METETKWNRVISQKNTIDDHYPKKEGLKGHFWHMVIFAMAESELLEYESGMRVILALVLILISTLAPKE